MAQNPGLASTFLGFETPTPHSFKHPGDSGCRGVECKPPAMSPEAYLHYKSKAVSKVPVPPCRGACRMRWLHFLMQIDLDPEVSGKFRGWIFCAAKQYDKEKRLGWSRSTCQTVRRLLAGHADSPAALSARETRLATAILVHYSPCCTPGAHGAQFKHLYTATWSLSECCVGCMQPARPLCCSWSHKFERASGCTNLERQFNDECSEDDGTDHSRRWVACPSLQS